MKILKSKSIVIDASNNCSLRCHMCERTHLLKNMGVKPPGGNLTVDQFKKIIKYYNHFLEFTGQRGDAILNDDLPEFLKLTKETVYVTRVNTAATLPYRNKDWYIECFKANPKTIWCFGIDGLPEQSHIYRKNQDGPKLFDIMVEATRHLESRPIWQYIVFRYNENNIEEAKQLAKDNGITFELNISSRWRGKDDPYKPIGEGLAKENIS